jgi:hypothetical protein
MGLGDDLMATAEARRRNMAGEPGPFTPVNKHGQPAWSPVFEHNPRLARAGGAVLAHRGGNRPYIDYGASSRTKWAWKDCPPEPGEIWFAPAEQAQIRPHGRIVIEPNLKAGASPNKDWGFGRWQELVRAMHRTDWIQLGPPGTRLLGGVSQWVTHDFRAALVHLAGARLYVGHEGALHHAAAALGIPAVVIFGGYVSPSQTGYGACFSAAANRPVSHANIYPDDPHSPCGMRVPCLHCKRVMESIGVDQVAQAVDRALSSVFRHAPA